MTTDDKQLPLFESEEAIDKLNSQKHKFEKEKPTPFSKYIVYVDESGDHGLQNIDKNYPYFVLAFCVFHKRHYSERVVPALEKFKFNHFGHDQVILHEREIRKETGSFNIFKSRAQTVKFIEELTEIIEYSNFILISCVIDKNSIRKQSDFESDPYHIALGLCLEELYDFLSEKDQQNLKTHIVVECRGKSEDKELELAFRRVCDGRNRLKKPLPLEILFSDKKAMSSGLQLADLVARPIGLSVLRPTQSNRAFDVLKNKFYCEGGRNNLGQNYIGKGLKIYPVLESEKPR